MPPFYLTRVKAPISGRERLPADCAAARNARWRAGAAGATGVVCAEQRLYSFSWKLLIKAGSLSGSTGSVLTVMGVVLDMVWSP